MSKKLDQYAGTLTLDLIADGINRARANAKRLCEDAKLLFDAERYPSALSLAILSIEESGKQSILRSMVSDIRNEHTKTLWREYRSHTKKNFKWTATQHVVPSKPTKLSDFADVFDDKSDHPQVLDQLKQLSLYTDCLGAGKWSSPEEAIDKELAQGILNIARIHAAGDKEITPRELQLWQTIVGDLNSFRSQEDANAALIRWYAAMQVEGLIDAGPNMMERFVKHGL